MSKHEAKKLMTNSNAIDKGFLFFIYLFYFSLYKDG